MPPLLSHKTVTWSLVLALGHVPIPWVHSHELLADERLEAHFSLCHNGADGNLPLGWHVHLIYIGMNHQAEGADGANHPWGNFVFCYEDPQDVCPESAVSRRSVRDGRESRLWSCHSIPIDDYPDLRSEFGALAFTAPAHQRKGAHFYDLYCSLLI